MFDRSVLHPTLRYSLQSFCIALNLYSTVICTVKVASETHISTPHPVFPVIPLNCRIFKPFEGLCDNVKNMSKSHKTLVLHAQFIWCISHSKRISIGVDIPPNPLVSYVFPCLSVAFPPSILCVFSPVRRRRRGKICGSCLPHSTTPITTMRTRKIHMPTPTPLLSPLFSFLPLPSSELLPDERDKSFNEI